MKKISLVCRVNVIRLGAVNYVLNVPKSVSEENLEIVKGMDIHHPDHATIKVLKIQADQTSYAGSN